MEEWNYLDNADTISINTLNLVDEIEQDRENDIAQLNKLSKSVQHLHSNLLYYRQITNKNKKSQASEQAWKALIKQIGCTPDTWRDLGHLLGVSQDDLDYILHSGRDDPADMVLKVFIDKDEEPTLDKVTDAFVKLKRYDILTKVKDPLINLVKSFEREAVDSGYVSNEDLKQKIITYKKYVNDLPAALTKNFNKNNNSNQPNKTLYRFRKISECKNNNLILFLTYAPDGYETALNIQQNVENWTDMCDIIVITLNGMREEVYQNPQKNIREYFEKATFIVPILTMGYLDALRSKSDGAPSTTENLDLKYVSFIYNLIANYYIHGSGCLNMKVRSVFPRNADKNVLRRISMYPELVPWTNENKFEEQFKAFLLKERSSR